MELEYKHSPLPGVPKFFKRDYDQRDAAAIRTTGDVVAFNPMAGQRITIYGYSIQSPYPEDWPAEERAFANTRTFFSMCFSDACPVGEVGFTPLDAVEEISAEEFERACDTIQGES